MATDIINGIDLSRERFMRFVEERDHSVSRDNAPKEAIEDWEKFGGFEKVRDFLLSKIFKQWDFRREFSYKAYTVNSTVHRYYLLQHLIEEGALDKRNLEGVIVDVGCHLGATVDALALFGGDVNGTDNGKFACVSPSGIAIGDWGGRNYVRAFHKKDGNRSYSKKHGNLSLVSCFNVGWVEAMSGEGFALCLYNDSLPALADGGQVLFTYNENESEKYKQLLELPYSRLVKIPQGLNEREDYAFTTKKQKGCLRCRR